MHLNKTKAQKYSPSHEFAKVDSISPQHSLHLSNLQHVITVHLTVVKGSITEKNGEY